LADGFKEFLKVIQKKLPSITPTPRCVVPPEHHPVGLDGHLAVSIIMGYLYVISCQQQPHGVCSLGVRCCGQSEASLGRSERDARDIPPD
jgi:hypothetical protein